MTEATDVDIEHEEAMNEEEGDAERASPESSGSLETAFQLDSDVESGHSSRQPLIDNNGCEDELEGCLQFIEGFSRLYGDNAPEFFAGTLETTAKEAFAGRRLLALYLHHVRSPSVHVFCSGVLCDERAREAFRNHCFLWGWDLSRSAARRCFLESCESALGRAAGRAVDVPKERLPAVVLASRVRSITEIRRVLVSTVSAEELVAEVKATAGELSLLLEVQAREDRARKSRERLRELQDLAYRESLEIDRAKDVEKRRKLEEKELKDSRERLAEENRRVEAETERRQLESELGEEPVAGVPSVTLRFRPPEGPCFQRSFLSSSRLQEVVNFTAVKGYGPRDFRLVAGWPRKDLSTLCPELTVREVGLAAQETVIIERR